MSAVKQARERGWTMYEAGCWTHPTLGEVELRDYSFWVWGDPDDTVRGPGWYTNTPQALLGPYRTMTEAMNAAEDA